MCCLYELLVVANVNTFFFQLTQEATLNSLSKLIVSAEQFLSNFSSTCESVGFCCCTCTRDNLLHRSYDNDMYYLWFPVDAKSQNEASETKPASETVDLKEVKRVDLILKSLYSKVHFVTRRKYTCVKLFWLYFLITFILVWRLDSFFCVCVCVCCLVQLPPAPPPPPFPEGYVSQEALGENEEELGTQGGESQQPQIDPIIDQGPAKRMKF